MKIGSTVGHYYRVIEWWQQIYTVTVQHCRFFYCFYEQFIRNCRIYSMIVHRNLKILSIKNLIRCNFTVHVYSLWMHSRVWLVFVNRFNNNIVEIMRLDSWSYIFLCIFRQQVRVMVFNATFNNISVISWRSVWLVEETRVPGEDRWPVTNFIT